MPQPNRLVIMLIIEGSSNARDSCIGRQNRVESKEHGPYVPSPGSESVLCHLLVR